MRDGSPIEFTPALFEPEIWITCIIEEEKLNAKLEKRVENRQYKVRLPRLQEITEQLTVKVQHGAKDGLYEFSGELQNQEPENIYQLKISETGHKIQDRRYERINIYHATTFTVLEKPMFTGNQYSANIEDISAGGAKLITSFKLVPENIIELDFTLADFPFASLKAEVVRNNQLARIKNRIYEVGVKFLCSAAERKQITGYVNRKQIEFKEQGLL